MDELNIQVVRAFGFKHRSIVKHKSNYICNTDKGQKIIKKLPAVSDETLNSIMFQHQVKECLYINGFNTVDMFNLTVKNRPYFVLEGNAYTSTDFFPFKESNFANAADFKNIVSKVALMHSILKKNAASNSFESEKKYICVESIYKSSIDKLFGIKKKISKFKQLSDFDVIYYKNYDYYVDCLNKWYDLIVKANFKNLHNGAIDQGYIVHNLLKEENILIDNHNVYITNFSECSYGYYISDLCGIIKRYFKSVSDNPMHIKEIIDVYNSINDLTNEEINALYAMLLFPDKFIKICSQYYSKNRTWIPGTFKSRIESTINTKNTYRKFIDEIYN